MRIFGKRGFAWNDMIVWIFLAVLALIIMIITIGYFQGYGFNAIDFIKCMLRGIC